MDPLLLLTLLLVGALAGVLGALFGIGGGIIIIPILTLFYGLTATEAAAVSLVGIVATSVGGTVFYVKNEVTNIRLGLLLEISTVIGSVIGAAVSAYIQEWAIMVIFAVVLLFSAAKMLHNVTADTRTDPNGEFSYKDLKTGEYVRYDIEHVRGGFALCSVAGVISSLTGVGGGIIKVPLMNLYMNVPVKAATATSSYMVGITAFSGAIVYLLSGMVILDVAAFITVGTFVGAMVGSHLTKSIDGSSMKKYFSVLLVAISAVMILQAGGIL